jgi:hypothetical protein
MYVDRGNSISTVTRRKSHFYQFHKKLGEAQTWCGHFGWRGGGDDPGGRLSIITQSVSLQPINYTTEPFSVLTPCYKHQTTTHYI